MCLYGFLVFFYMVVCVYVCFDGSLKRGGS